MVTIKPVSIKILCFLEKTMFSVEHRIIYSSLDLRGLSSDSVVKDLPEMQEMQEMWFLSLDLEIPLEEGMGTHSSILA